MYDGWFTIALLTSGFGQVWAKLGLQRSRTTLGEMHDCTIVQLQTKDQLTSTTGIWTKLGLKNRMTAQLCSCGHNATAVA